MGKLEGSDGALKAVLEYDGLPVGVDQNLSFHGPEMTQLRNAILTLHTAVGITEFEWKQLADPLDYRYEFTVTDGRVWRQTFRFAVPGNPTMTFADVAGVWRTSECVSHRALWELMVTLRNMLEVTKCKVTIL
jgi:hypothetical protein